MENDPRFTALQQLTDDKLTLDISNGVVMIDSLIDNEHMTKPSGTNLIRELVADPSGVEIHLTTEISEHMTEAIFDQEHKNLIGFKQVIQFNPSQVMTVLTVKNEQRESPYYIILGHELIHAYRAINGLSNNSDDGWVYPLWRDEVPTERLGKIYRPKVEELETVGVPYTTDLSKIRNKTDEFDIVSKDNDYVNAFTKYRYTENSLRVENLIPMRAGYGE